MYTGGQLMPGDLYELEQVARDKRSQLNAIFTPQTFEGVMVTTVKQGNPMLSRAHDLLAGLIAKVRQVKGGLYGRFVASGAAR
jgi:hypothetical protein